MPNEPELGDGDLGDFNNGKLLNALYISLPQFIRK